MSSYPYKDRFPVNRTLPAKGRPRDEVVAELRALAAEEDASWESGRVSGTMYCGDHDHYAFMNEVFGLYAHVNVLQRDICPSATRFEGEIIAMALDLFHASAVDDGEPVGLVTSGGTGSIAHAVLAYREVAREERGVTRPNFIKPETGHPAFDKACHLFGIELRQAPIDPETTLVDVDAVRDLIDDQTIGMMGSACNYGYGTIDPIEALSDLAVEKGIPLHVDGCLGGFILPFGQELGYPNIPVFDFRLPGSPPSRPTPTSTATPSRAPPRCCSATRSGATRSTSSSPTGPAASTRSPGMDGSRSGGLLAATWAAMVQLGREGYLAYADKIFATSLAMQDAVRSHPELRIMGDPSFLFSFTSDEFDVYHINDFMRPKGWRFNGQQYPNALHMAVTRPQTQPGVVEAFANDLAAAVEYAKEKGHEPAASGAIYGGVAGGMNDEADEFIKMVMAQMLDEQQALPPID
jgi:sphinganine-1-phosphate aldolase